MKHFNNCIKRTQKNITKLVITGLYGFTIASLPLPLNQSIHSVDINQKAPIHIKNIKHYNEVSNAIYDINEHFNTNTFFNFENNKTSNIKYSYFQNNSFNNTSHIYIIENNNTNEVKNKYLFHILHEYMHSQTYNYIHNNFINLNKKKLTIEQYEKINKNKLNLNIKKTQPYQYLNTLLPLAYTQYLHEAYSDALSIMVLAKLASKSKEKYRYFKTLTKTNIVGFRAVNFLNKNHYNHISNEKIFKYYFSKEKQDNLKSKTLNEVFSEGMNELIKNNYIQSIDDYKITLIALYNLSGDNDFNRLLKNEQLEKETFNILAQANTWHQKIEYSKLLNPEEKNNLLNKTTLNIINNKIETVSVNNLNIKELEVFHNIYRKVIVIHNELKKNVVFSQSFNKAKDKQDWLINQINTFDTKKISLKIKNKILAQEKNQ